MSIASVRWIVLACILAFGALSTARFLSARTRAAVVAAPDYQCPMHAQVVSIGPSACPICGMDLSPMRASAIRIEPDRQRLIGLRTTMVEQRDLARRITIPASIVAADSHVSRVVGRYTGVVASVAVVDVGVRVSKGQVLARVTSEAATALLTQWLAQGPGNNSLAAKLTAFALGNADLEEASARLAAQASGQSVPMATIAIRAPRSGVVLEKSVSAGSAIALGSELFTIADVSSVWAVGEIFGEDIRHVKTGDAATLVGDGGAPVSGRLEVAAVPQHALSGGVPVRLVLANDDGAFRLGSAARIVVESDPATTLVVPGSAVLENGEGAAVFVAQADDRFERRSVSLGRYAGSTREVIEGLQVGEQVVSSAALLLEAESRLNAVRKDGS